MKNVSVRLLAALSLFAFPALCHAQNLLPKPRKVEMGKGYFRTDRPYRTDNAAGCIAKDFRLDSAAVVTEDASAPRVLRCAVLEGASSPEAYALRVRQDTLEVRAAAAEGFLRARQTLAQLRTRHGVPCCDIADAPAYRWRGVMLDVSRHFFPLSFLKKQVDVLSAYKLNTLHLHLTDAAGWRMEIKRYPRLADFAAWRTDLLWKTWWNNGERHYARKGDAGAYGGYYTQDELRELVAYAAARGVTVVPEIEMPAHSEEVLTAYPELSCTHEPYKQADFCPGSVATYDFLENVLREVMDVFPSRYIHVGGDEAGKASWGTCPLCRAKMEELGIKDVNGLQTHLIARMGDFLARHGRRLVGWDEVIDGNLSDSTTVMVWRNPDLARDAVRHGYDVVLSPGAYCYLDSYQDAPPTQPEAIGGYLPLEKVYAFCPGEGLTAEERKHVAGVQGNLWTEYVPTEAQAEYMLYPRALALAEIGWNGDARAGYADFSARAARETARLRGQCGVNAFPVSSAVGERKEKSVSVRHKALGAKVSYAKRYSDSYAAGGESALTDGLRGGWANNDGRWQGFIGAPGLDVTLDLGRAVSVSEVSADFMQACGPEIFYPSSFRVSLSADGKDFREVYSSSEKSVKTVQPDVRAYRWKGRSQKARYVRVQAAPSDFGGWLFTDEIVVR